MRYILKIEPRELVGGLHVECERKAKSQGWIQGGGQGILVDDRVTFWDEEEQSVVGFGGTMGNQEFKLESTHFGSSIKYPKGWKMPLDLKVAA